MVLKIINESKNPTPKYATAGAAGMDLHANLDDLIGVIYIVFVFVDYLF